MQDDLDAFKKVSTKCIEYKFVMQYIDSKACCIAGCSISRGVS